MQQTSLLGAAAGTAGNRLIILMILDNHRIARRNCGVNQTMVDLGIAEPPRVPLPPAGLLESPQPERALQLISRTIQA